MKFYLGFLALCLLAVFCDITKGEFTKADCNNPPETGGNIRCLAAFRVYTWNAGQKKCEQVIYGGCHASNNNFKTEEDCNEIAKPICSE